MIDLNRISEIEILYRNKVKAKNRMKMINSKKVRQTVRPYFEDFIEHHEEMRCLYMNRVNEAIGMVTIGTGGTNGVISDPKIIFQNALKLNASSLILIHNHPSGTTKPSENDIKLTNKVVAAGKLLDIEVLDHLILASDNAHFSFADNNMM